MGVLILRGTSRQAAGGGRGGKLDSWVSSVAADGRVEHGGESRTVEDEGIRPDDPRGRRTGVCTGLRVGRGAGMTPATGKRLE